MADLIVKILKIVALVAVVGVICTYMLSTFIPALSGFSATVDVFIGYLGTYLYCARTILNWLFGSVIVNVFLIAWLVLPFVKLGLRWIWRLQNLDKND